MRNDVLEGDIVVREIGGQIGSERLQVFGEGRLVLDRRADREHAGEETDSLPELSHGTLSDFGTNDEGALCRVLVEEQVIWGEEGGKRGGRSRGNVVIVPLESGGVNLVLDLANGALLDLRRRGEGQNEWLYTIQLLAPVLQLLVTKFGSAVCGADQPVTVI